jgi:hypothetical protein
MGDVYIGPYTATSGGNAFSIICDDFVSDSCQDETWEATTSTFNNISTTKWGSGAANGYYEAAWLSDRLWDPSTAAAGAIQDAIWQVFSPIAFNSLTGADLANAQSWLHQAELQTYTAGEFAHYVIYTPTAAAPTGGGGPCPTSPPQKFLRRVPEPATLPLMAIALGAVVVWGRRSAQRR